MLTYINCLLTDVSSRATPYRRNLFKEALQNGYLVKLTNGKVWEGYTEAGMVDLSNPSAYKWMLDIVQQVSMFSYLLSMRVCVCYVIMLD